MKKLFKATLLLFIGLIISSCSSNEDNLKTASEIRMTINGNEVVFDNVIVNKLSGEEGTSISVSGSVGAKTDKILNFYFYDSQVGADALSDVTYTVDGYTYGNTAGTCGDSVYSSSISNITNVNDGSKISGNFSGTFEECNNGSVEKLVITNGSYNVTY